MGKHLENIETRNEGLDLNNKYYRAYFLKSLINFLIPMLIPLLVMGTLSIILIQQYVKETINDNNINLLEQTKENMEMIFNDLDSLNLYIITSANEFTNLQKMMAKRTLNQKDAEDLASFKSFINSSISARPYIDSVYIYYQNYSGKFLSSTTDGLVNLAGYPDYSWFNNFYYYTGKELTWSEARTVNKTLFERIKTPTSLITMYRKISDNDGVLVLNIKSGYLEDRLENLVTNEGQSIFILNDENNIIFKDKKYALRQADIDQIISEPSPFFEKTFSDKPFVISKLSSTQYGWNYVSVTPKQNLYHVPKRLLKIVLALLFICIISSTGLALYLTKKIAADIKTILAIFESAEQGTPLPPIPSTVNNLYSYIIDNILKNYLEHNYLKMRLSEQKYKEQAMEFAALQSQLNPHFLFNTLETINWKAIALTGRPNELNEMIENLAAILRYSLDEENKMVPFMEEIKYTIHYIKIQKVRYKDQFNVIWEFGTEVENNHVKKLILQPLIENVLQHGMMPGKRCLIKIKIKLVANHLEISVIDNGKGMTAERLGSVQERLNSNAEYSNHIGLFNTNKRLIVTYGNEYGLVIRSKLGWGTIIRIIIPK